MSTATLENPVHSRKPLSVRRRFYSLVAITLIWAISLLVLLLGLPLIIFQAIGRAFRKH